MLKNKCQNFWLLAHSRDQLQAYIEWFCDSLPTHLATRQPQNAQKQLFKGTFRGKPVLNLLHPLLHPSFNIFTSKSNQFDLKIFLIN